MPYCKISCCCRFWRRRQVRMCVILFAADILKVAGQPVGPNRIFVQNVADSMSSSALSNKITDYCLLFSPGRFPIRTKRSLHQIGTIRRRILCHCLQRIQQVSFLKQEKLLGGEIFLEKCIPHLRKSHVSFSFEP